MHRYWRLSALFSIGLFILLAGVGLVACGANPTQAYGSTSAPATKASRVSAPITTPTILITNNPTPTATSGTANNPTAVSTHTIVANTPVLPLSPPVQSTNIQNCGVVDTSSLHRLQDAGLTQQAGECFWQAFQQCHNATLLFHDGGTGTSTNHSFLMESRNGNCTITDTVSLKTTTQGTFTCTGLIKTTGILQFTNCGAEGNIAVQLI